MTILKDSLIECWDAFMEGFKRGKSTWWTYVVFIPIGIIIGYFL